MILDTLERQGDVNAEKVGRATRYSIEVSQLSHVASVTRGHKGVTLHATPDAGASFTPTPEPITPEPASTITRLRDGTALHTLILTDDWQEIPLDWAVPYGAETKTNKAEGLNYARLAPVATPPPEPVDDLNWEEF